MILLIHGTDALAVRRRLDSLKVEADGGSGMLMSNLTALSGRDTKVSDILGPVMSPPFLGPKRLVLVEDYVERFQRSERGPAGGGGRVLDAAKPLFEALQRGIPASTILVFLAPELGANPFVTELKKLADVNIEAYPAPEKENLVRFIREEAALRGIKFRPGPFTRTPPYDEELRKVADPAQLLAALANQHDEDADRWHSDTLGIANELDKLALFTLGRDATVDDVFEACAGQRSSNRFNFVDAVMDGNLQRALEMLALLTRDGEATQALLALLMAGYRRSAGIIGMLEDGATPDEIGKSMGNAGKYPNLRDAAIRRARTIGPQGLKAAYATLVAAERGFKMGEVQDEVALEIAIAKLAALARPTLARR